MLSQAQTHHSVRGLGLGPSKLSGLTFCFVKVCVTPVACDEKCKQRHKSVVRPWLAMRSASSDTVSQNYVYQAANCWSFLALTSRYEETDVYEPRRSAAQNSLDNFPTSSIFWMRAVAARIAPQKQKPAIPSLARCLNATPMSPLGVVQRGLPMTPASLARHSALCATRKYQV